MKPRHNPLLWLVIFLGGTVLSLQLPAAITDLPTEEAVPGGIAIIPISTVAKNINVDDSRPLIHFNDHRVMVIPSGNDTVPWLAIVGIPRSATAGQHAITVQHSRERSTKHFQVKRKRYPEQHIQIANKRLVNPEKRDMNRILKESRIMKQAFTSWSNGNGDRLRMDWPVYGPVSSPFGLTRFFNQQPRRPHSGIDIAAPKGSPIKAPKSGKVIATGHYFFNGNTVIVDHGQGLISMFCHLDSINVETGYTLDRGEQLGTVGQTGRATGPHLHWSVNLNNVRVDPMLFLDKSSNRSQ